MTENALRLVSKSLVASLNGFGREMVDSTGSLTRLQNNSTLILEMAKTASLLSSQLRELHKSLNVTTPSTAGGKLEFLTPVSSGYNSIKSSRENLTSCNGSFNLSITSTSAAELSLGSICSSDPRTRLFKDDSIMSMDTSLSSSTSSSSSLSDYSKKTPLKMLPEAPEIPRIKEKRREIANIKRRAMFSFRRFAKKPIFKKLIYSSPCSR